MGRIPSGILKTGSKADSLGQSKFPPRFTLWSLVFLPIRCIKDSSYAFLPSHQKNMVQFKFNAFSFLDSYDVVYLQCKVAVCQAGDPSARCSQGCVGQRRKEAGLMEAKEAQDERYQLVGPLGIPRAPGQSHRFV